MSTASTPRIVPVDGGRPLTQAEFPSLWTGVAWGVMPKTSEKIPAPRQVAFETLRKLFGRKLDAPEVVRFLAKHPEHVGGRPYLGDQYVEFKPLGFGFLFRPPMLVDEAQKSKHLRVLDTIFLYPEGKDRYREFRRPPFGIIWTETRASLVEKLGPPGEFSPSTNRSILWAAWRIEELRIHASFDPDREVLQGMGIGLRATWDARKAEAERLLAATEAG